jgi:hypothetical protein
MDPTEFTMIGHFMVNMSFSNENLDFGNWSKNFAKMFEVHERIVTRIMAHTNETLHNGVLDASNRNVLSGHKPKYSVQSIRAKLTSTPPKNVKVSVIVRLY